MKKLLFVVSMCVAVVSANAQEKKDAPKNEAKAKTEQSVQKPMKTMVKEADLLQPIKDNIAKDFAGATVVKAFKMENKEGLTYVVIVKKDMTDWKLVYDKDGKFMKKHEMKKMEKIEKKADGKKVEEKKATEQLKQ